MKFSTVARHIREGFKNVGRNGWMTFASVSSIAVSLFILGIFMLLALNVNKLADQLDSQVQINVYLQLDTVKAKSDAIERSIKRIPEVKSVTFVSKDEGLKRFRESMGADGKDALDGYEKENNPLPDSFEVEAFDPQKVSFIAKQIEALNLTDPAKSITKVKYGKETIEKLFSITNAVRNIGIFIVLGLAVMAMFLISTTIKMTIIARRREISIMKLVGATNSFIRWPFFIEGAIIGFGGSFISSAILMYGYSQLVRTTSADVGLYMIEFATVNEVRFLVGGTIVVLGTLLGIWGSTISVRRYLKV
ncbi:permease-like cell division protein FtsX [Cohnella silvisoli]|uniref:Cell division protein FtsX n=1 Tax=Cohnella silvisoli TaxID=2873699 RepID=A0ABV1KPG8_9BACL|nr:permease-like cell division protein FtsX [Cohnella silvisoli]MCD9022342.1 permease-like cell division protein FtsX [Cohnella silvisoli]